MTLRRTLIAILALAGLASCTDPVMEARSIGQLMDARDTRIGRQDFAEVVTRVEPRAEALCRQRTRNLNCDFRIVVDERSGVPPMAFVTLDEADRPVIVFSIALIDEMQNSDEMAFVLSHEAAHHILDHFRRGRENADLGARVFAQTAGAAGVSDPEALAAAQRLGALVGQRTFSRDFELEADALGTRIAAYAGYDPVVGAQFFFRIPDPGDRYLGTHPPNAERVAIVNQTAAELAR